MFDNFSVVPHGGVIGVPPQAQILMPMPPLDQLPKNEQEWQALSDKIYLGLRIKVQSAVASGNSNLEVLQIENVTLAQHLEGTVLKSESSILESILPDLKSILPSAEVQQAVEVQQNNVKFAGAVGQAIYKVQKDFEGTDSTLTVDVKAGSNGGRTLPDAIVDLAQQDMTFVSGVDLVDSRGGIAHTEAMMEVVGPANVRIFNTLGDAPAFPEIAGGSTIANRDVAHQIKQDFPDVREFDTQPANGDILSSIPGANHNMLMEPDSPPILLKEFTGFGYTEPKFFLNPTQALLNPDGSGLKAPDSIDASARSMNVFGGNGADQVASPQPSQDGNSVLVNGAAETDFTKLLDQAQSRNQSIDSEISALRGQLRDQNSEMTNLDNEFIRAQADRTQSEAFDKATAQFALPLPQPTIPSSWVPCTCPADHPNAGLLVNGVRWHTPLLNCPR